MVFEARQDSLSGKEFSISEEAAEVLRAQGGVSLVVNTGYFQKTIAGILHGLKEKNIPITLYQPESPDSTLLSSLSEDKEHGVVMVLSDCASRDWYTGELPDRLQQLAQAKNVVVMPLFPRVEWDNTALGIAHKGQNEAGNMLTPILSNAQITFVPDRYDSLSEKGCGENVPLALVAPTPQSLHNYSQMLAGREAHVGFVYFDVNEIRARQAWRKEEEKLEIPSTPEELIENFVATTPPRARLLASLLAAAPITFGVQERIRTHVMGNLSYHTNTELGTEADFAKVAMGGLLKRSDTIPGGFDFVPGIREIILPSLPISYAQQVLLEAADVFGGESPSMEAEYIQLAQGNFDAVRIDQKTDPTIVEFAKIAAMAWRGMYSGNKNAIANIEQAIAQHPTQQKPKALGKPTAELDISLIEKDHGLSFLRNVTLFDEKQIQTFGDLQVFNGFEVAFKEMAVFLAQNPGNQSKALKNERKDTASPFGDSIPPSFEVDWMGKDHVLTLVLEYVHNEELQDMADPAKISLQVTVPTAGMTEPVFVYDLVYKRLGNEEKGSSFGGISNGTTRQGFMIERKRQRVSITGIENDMSSDNMQETAHCIAVIMQKAAHLLLTKYQEIIGFSQELNASTFQE